MNKVIIISLFASLLVSALSAEDADKVWPSSLEQKVDERLGSSFQDSETLVNIQLGWEVHPQKKDNPYQFAKPVSLYKLSNFAVYNPYHSQEDSNNQQENISLTQYQDDIFLHSKSKALALPSTQGFTYLSFHVMQLRIFIQVDIPPPQYS